MDQLAALRVFVDVARTGSLSESARNLGLAPSSVTRQINGLEKKLGVRLLNRTTRHVSLTEAGQVYQERARRLVSEVEDMDRAVAELDATPRGTLRVSAPVVLGRVQVAPRLPEFLARHPNLSVELSLSDQIIDLAEDGIDVAMRIAVELPDSTLIAKRLFTMRRVICASPSYLEVNGAPGTPFELVDHECLTFRLQTTSELWRPGARVWRLSEAPRRLGEAPRPLSEAPRPLSEAPRPLGEAPRRLGEAPRQKPDATGQGAGTADVPVSGRFESNNGDALVEAAVNGLGLALLPAWHVAEHLHSGRLVQVLTEYAVNPGVSESSVFVVFPSNRYLSPKVRAFVEFVAEVFQGHS